MTTLPDSVALWRDRGRMLDVSGLEVFVLDTGPADAEEAVLVLHGFPTSSHDWHSTLPFLGDRRVVLLDFIGFGLSEKPVAFSYSLHEQTDLVLGVLRELAVRRVHIVSHDMGTSVACELVARRERELCPVEIRSLVLMNGSVHIELSQLTPSQKLLLGPAGGLFTRIASERLFRAQMRRIVGRPISGHELEAMWAGIRWGGGVERLTKTIGYVRERWQFAERWIGGLERFDRPCLVLWGPRDPVAVLAIAERLVAEIPGARLELLDGLGHYPQVEDPEATGSAIRTFLESVDEQP